MSWLYSFIWSVLPFFTNNRYALEGFLTSCSFDYISTNLSNRIVIISMFIGGFLVPMSLIALFYILIICLLRKNEIYLSYQIRNKTINSSQNIYPNSLYQNGESSLNKNKKFSTSTIRNFSEILNHSEGSIYSKKEIKLVKMISLIVLMFLIAWTPYAVITLAAQFGSNIEAYINPYTTSLPALLAKTSSVYNPLIYTLSNKEFRKFFSNYFLKK